MLLVLGETSNRNHRFCSLMNWQASRHLIRFHSLLSNKSHFSLKAGSIQRHLVSKHPNCSSLPCLLEQISTAFSGDRARWLWVHVMDCPLFPPLPSPPQASHISSSLPDVMSYTPAKHRIWKRKLVINLPVPSLSLSFPFPSEDCWSSQCGPCSRAWDRNKCWLGTSRVPSTRSLGLTRTKDFLNISAYAGFWNARVRLSDFSKHEFSVQLGRGLYLILYGIAG